MSGTWLAAVVFSCLFLSASALALPVVTRPRHDGRVDLVKRYANGGGGQALTPTDPRPVKSRAVITGFALRVADRAVRKRDRRERLIARLQAAGLALRPAEWLALRVCVAIAGAALLFAPHPHPLTLLLGGGLGWAATAAYLRVRTARRRRAFADDLAEMLQLLAGSLRSGFSLQQAMDAAARESRDPMGSELRRAIAEARFGTRLEDALAKVSVRMDSEDFTWVVLAIRIQREVGGNLADILLTTAGTIRERAFLARHVKALSAEGRMSAYILIAMPIGIAGWMSLTARDYIAPLFTTTIGKAMLAAMAVQLVIGYLWLRKTIQVKV
jgi:Flp pilus assembly protein TadB